MLASLLIKRAGIYLNPLQFFRPFGFNFKLLLSEIKRKEYFRPSPPPVAVAETMRVFPQSNKTGKRDVEPKALILRPSWQRSCKKKKREITRARLRRRQTFFGRFLYRHYTVGFILRRIFMNFIIAVGSVPEKSIFGKRFLLA